MKSQIRITYRDKDNNIIENPTEGQRAYSPETKQFYLFTNNKWEHIKSNGDLRFSTYELNKQLIAQEQNLENDEKALEEGKNLIASLTEKVADSYFMLLCRDIQYYTVFNITEDKFLRPLADEVIDCLHDIGAIKSIDFALDNSVEIWVQPVCEEPMVMYLFPYDRGVIQCRV